MDCKLIYVETNFTSFWNFTVGMNLIIRCVGILNSGLKVFESHLNRLESVGNLTSIFSVTRFCDEFGFEVGLRSDSNSIWIKLDIYLHPTGIDETFQRKSNTTIKRQSKAIISS